MAITTSSLGSAFRNNGGPHTAVDIQYRGSYLSMNFPLTGDSRQDADMVCKEIYRALREFPSGYPWNSNPQNNNMPSNNNSSEDDEEDEVVPLSDTAKRLGDTFE